MLFPNKVISYNESILSKFAPILNRLKKSPMRVSDLYQGVCNSSSDISEFIDALDCLYALRAIEYDSEKEVICYVERDIL